MSRKISRASAASHIDRDGFEAEMRLQRERARASWKGGEKGAIAPAYQQLLEKGRTQFLGYDQLDAVSKVTGLFVDRQPVDELAGGHGSRTRARSDAVLRRNRRPGGRSRHALRRPYGRDWSRSSKTRGPRCPALRSTRSARVAPIHDRR